MKRLLTSFAFFATLACVPAADLPGPTGADAVRAFPYSMVGQLLFANGNSYFSGSGTVIRPSSVLTAAHNLWDADSGFSTDILFSRGHYGATNLSQQYASRIYVLGGYRENARRFTADNAQSFSCDTGALIFRRPVADGSYAGWWADPALLTGTAKSFALGYGAEFHSGDELLSVAPTQPYFPAVGAFYENTTLYFESGMSGGPVFGYGTDGKLYVTGVVVAGGKDPFAGGIRILDGDAATFIRTYMR